MRIERIEFNKVKVTVSHSELDNMNISINSLRPDSAQLHHFLFRIMELVKKETDFNPYSGQIMVEAMPTDDSVILTVTKVSDEKPRSRKITPDDLKSSKIRAVSSKKPTHNSVFYFSDFDTMIKTVSHLSDETLKHSSYYKSDSVFALSITAPSPKDIPVLKEFCESFEINNPLAKHFLKEHFNLILTGKELINTARGIKEYNL